MYMVPILDGNSENVEQGNCLFKINIGFATAVDVNKLLNG